MDSGFRRNEVVGVGCGEVGGVSGLLLSFGLPRILRGLGLGVF